MGTIKIEASIDAFGMRFPFYMYQIFNCGRWCVYLFLFILWFSLF